MHVRIRAYIDKCIHITHPQMPRKESDKNKTRNTETVPCHSKCNSKSNGSLGRPDVRHQYINYRATDKKDAYFAEETPLDRQTDRRMFYTHGRRRHTDTDRGGPCCPWAIDTPCDSGTADPWHQPGSAGRK